MKRIFSLILALMAVQMMFAAKNSESTTSNKIVVTNICDDENHIIFPIF